jgi:TatD DNase family protein
MARRPEVVAYGELGLDYYYDNAPREVQQEVLREQLRLARKVGLPVIVHDRDAHDDMLAILDEEGAWELGVVIHCFSGDMGLAEQCLSRGAWLSIPGVVTFKNATALHEVAAKAPLEKLFIETDSPYLAPVPYRGKRNEPAYVHAVAREIAKLRETDANDVARITSENARSFFRLPG